MENKPGFKTTVTIVDSTHLTLLVKVIGQNTKSFQLSYPAGSDIDAVCRAAFPDAFVEAIIAPTDPVTEPEVRELISSNSPS